jgi:hypothetical protein
MNYESRITNTEMVERRGRSARGRFLSFVIRHSSFPLILALASCNNPNAQWNNASSASRPTPDAAPQSNVVRVTKFFSQNPWLSFTSDGSGKVDGVGFAVYLEGANGPRGVFGTGTIVVTMYRLDFDPLGREAATPVHEWVLTPDKAYPWRAKKATALGWGYGLRLQWPDTVRVGGKQVAFLVKYVREDGREISSSRQVLKVPVGGSAMPPPVAATGRPVARPTPTRAQ